MARGLRAGLVVAVALALGCGDGGDGGGALNGEAGGGVSEEAAADSVSVAVEGGAAPSLFTIMLGLQADMDAIQHGIWAGDTAAIGAAAMAVADHPRVTEAQRRAIFEILGDEAAQFGAADVRVHDDAVAVAQAAHGGPRAALPALARLQEGCVACHEAFRDPLAGRIAR